MNTVMIIILNMSQQAGPRPRDHRPLGRAGAFREPSMPEPDSIMTHPAGQARAVTAILAAMPDFRSARQIHAALRASVEAGASEVRRWAGRVAARTGFTGVAGSAEMSVM